MAEEIDVMAVLTAAGKGDVKGLVELVKAHGKEAVLAVRDPKRGASPLHFAVAGNKKQMVTALLKISHDMNVQANNGDTPLHWALNKNFMPIATILMKEGASSDIANAEGKTAKDVIKELKKAKAEKAAAEGGGEDAAEAPADGAEAAEPAAEAAAEPEVAAAPAAAEPEPAPAAPAHVEVAAAAATPAPAAVAAAAPVASTAAPAAGYNGPPVYTPTLAEPSAAIKNARDRVISDAKFRSAFSGTLRESSAAKVIVNVYNPDFACKKMAIPTDYTISECCDMYADKIGLHHVQPFTLVEMVVAAGASTDRLDIKTQYTERSLPLGSTLEALGIGKDANLMFRPHLYKFMLDNIDDHAAFDIYLCQAKLDIVKGVYAVTEANAVRLAAIYIHFRFGNHNRKIHKVGFFTELLPSLFPKAVLDSNPAVRLEERIARLHAPMAGFPQLLGAKKYISMVRQMPTYGARIFPAQVDGRDGNVGVAEDGVFLRSGLDNWSRYTFKEIASIYKLSTTIQVTIKGEDGGSGRVEFGITATDATEFLDYFWAYYNMLLLSEKPDDNCKISGSIQLPSFPIPPASLFTLPPEKRYVDQPFYSRADYFKHAYVQRSRELELGRLDIMLSKVEDAEDMGTMFDTLNLKGFEQELKQLEVIARCLSMAHSYVPIERTQFRENMSLKHITIANCNLGQSYTALQHGSQFLDQFAGLEFEIRSFDISGNNLLPDMMAPLAAKLKLQKPLTILKFTDNNLNYEGLRAVVLSLGANQGQIVRQFVLNRTQLDDRAAHFFAGQLCLSTSTIEIVELSENSFTDEGIKEILEAVRKGKTCRDVNLSQNKFEKKAHKELEALLSSDLAVRSWYLNECHLKSAVVAEFVPHITQGMIGRLELSGNDFGNKACMPIAEALATAPALQHLALDDNKLEKSFAAALAEGLKNNRTLTHLSLKHNSIGSAGAKEIVAALASNSKLVYLGLADNKITHEAFEEFEAAMRRNVTLEEVDLSGNPLTDRAAPLFAAGLNQDHLFVKRLRLDKCKISDVGVNAITEAMRHNTKLELLSLARNDITQAGVSALFAVIANSAHLKTIDVSRNDANCIPVVRAAVQNPDFRVEVAEGWDATS